MTYAPPKIPRIEIYTLKANQTERQGVAQSAAVGHRARSFEGEYLNEDNTSHISSGIGARISGRCATRDAGFGEPDGA